jgi:hypothetical protein
MNFAMSTLYEKIAALPRPLLMKVEQFVDSLPASKSGWDDIDYADPDWKPPPTRETGRPKRRKAGFMKGTFIMHDNFFEPDDVWEEYT